MNKRLVQFKIYRKIAKVVFWIIMLVILFNMVLGNVIYNFDDSQSYDNSPINISFLLTLNVAVVVIILLPIFFSYIFPYFINFSITRRRYFINTVIYNMGISAVLSVIITFMYFCETILYGTKAKPMYYMGISSLDLSLVTFFTSIIMFSGIIAVLTSIIFLIYFVFYKMGVIYGLSAILIVLSILLFSLKNIVEFVNWGQNPLMVGVSLILIGLGINMLTYPIVCKSEIKK